MVTTAQLQAGGCSPAEGREEREAPWPRELEHPPPGIIIIIIIKDGCPPRWRDGGGFTLP